MSEKYIKNKKLVYWGAGNIGRVSIEYNSETEPCFFIDLRTEVTDFFGKKVIHPNEITDWKEYFIVVTHKGYRETFQFLNSIGLEFEVDYNSYVDFFGIDMIYSTDILEDTYKRALYSDITNKTLIVSDFLMPRVKNLRCFFSEMSNNGEVIALCNLLSVNRLKYEKIIGMPVIALPEIFDAEINDGEINDEEVCSLKKILNRKKSCIDISQVKRVYLFMKKLFGILKPIKCIIWSGWELNSYIIEYLCKKMNVQYFYMEFGWIPGTFQLDPCGIAGQSICEKDYESILKNNVSVDDLNKVNEIIEYVISNKMDSNKSNHVNDGDYQQLFKLKQECKTVFLIGMDDYGMNMNPYDDYWKTNISSLFKSTKEAVMLLWEVCHKNGWNFIFKPHPFTGDKNISYRDELDDEIILINDISVHELINMSDVVISISSAVEYLALIYGKTLVQVGITALNHSGASYVVDSIEKIEENLINAVNKKDLDLKIKNRDIFFSRLLKSYLWDDKSHPDFVYGRDIFIEHL